jgi:hypothetical protein
MRILSICPCSRGFGFAVMEEGTGLIDWGVKSAKGDKNQDCLRHIETMLDLYHPNIVVLEDARSSRRTERVRKLTDQVKNLAKGQKVRVKLLSPTTVMERFVHGGTRHDLAVLMALRFPEELSQRLPPKRKPWQSEDGRLDMFKAVALGLHILEYPQPLTGATK